MFKLNLLDQGSKLQLLTMRNSNGYAKGTYSEGRGDTRRGEREQRGEEEEGEGRLNGLRDVETP